MNLNDAVNTVSNDLNDNIRGHEFLVWSAESIRGWLLEAVDIAFARRPDLFMTHKVIKVESCTPLQSTCGCYSIRRVIGQSTEDGRVIRMLREMPLSLNQLPIKDKCRRTDNNTITSYSIDTVSNTLYVFPILPPGVDAYLLVECAAKPDGADELDPAYATAAIQWALWRARSKDAEVSPQAMAVAQMNYRAFFDLLSLPVDLTETIHKKG